MHLYLRSFSERLLTKAFESCRPLKVVAFSLLILTDGFMYFCTSVMLKVPNEDIKNYLDSHSDVVL